MEREVRFARLRPSQIIAERNRCPLAFLPIGPLEWHGPHLPLGTDPLNAREVSLRLAREVGGVVLPTLFLGTERERRPEVLRSIGFRGDEYIVGMDFPGLPMPSLYWPEEVLAIVVRHYLDLLVRQGYKLIVLLNGHGADNQIQVLRRLALEYTHTRPARVLMLMPAMRSPGDYYNGSHATRVETAIMQAVTESVDLGALPQGPLRNVELAIVDELTFQGNPTPDFTVRPEDDPRRATPEEGERHLRAIVADLAEVIQAELSRVPTHPRQEK
jgi:creatinine amidohydrolase